MLVDARVPFGYVYRKIRYELFWVIVIEVLVQTVVKLNRQSLPDIPVSIPAFLGTAISLVLSFKLNHSYDRWWEARKIWGAIVNDSRSLVRQLLTLVDGDPELARRVARRQIAWCYCLGQSLRGLDWTVGASEHLSPEEHAEAEKHDNRSVALLQMHARDIASLAADGHLSDFRRVAIDETLGRLTDSMGMAERIRNTVFPTTYRVFLHLSIYLFLAMLSIALAEIAGVWQFVTTTIIAIPLLLLEKTAKHLQDPFANLPTDCPVTSIAQTIEVNLRQLLGERDVPRPSKPTRFYVM